MSRIETVVRWAVRGDAVAMLQIEREAFGEAPAGGTAVELLGHPRVVCLVATVEAGSRSGHVWTRCFADDRVAGYVVYRFGLGETAVLRLAVAASLRRRGVGGTLLRAIQAKVSVRRPRVVMAVSEENLAAQLWLRAIGWRAVAVQGESYLFQWPEPRCPAWAWEDRG